MGIPYPLRQGKFIDRALLVDLLMHVDRWTPLRDSVYIGMGGPSLEDHKLLHSAFGLNRSVSIERDIDIFQRQVFNRPIKKVTCLHTTTKDFIDEFGSELKRLKISEEKRRIVWLDYESPSELMQQLGEFQALIGIASDGDILRITLNAHAGSLGKHSEGQSEDDLKAKRFERLKERFGDFLAESATLEMTTTEMYPQLVIDAVRKASFRATSEAGSREFLPLLSVRYSDGQPMVSVTGIVIADGKKSEFLKQSGLRRWGFYSNGWSVTERIEVPYLTVRERLLLDQSISSRHKLPKKLSFLGSDGHVAGMELVRRYRRFQRFFPQFQHVNM